MLILSLLMSAILLGVVLFAGRSRIPVETTVVVGILIVLPFCFLSVVSAAVLLHAFLLIVTAVICSVAGWPARRFLVLSCLATLAAYGTIGGFAYREVAQLLEKYPYVSMEARLPQRGELQRPFPEAALGRLDSLEQLIDGVPHGSVMDGLRVHQLESLHEHTLSVFANRPGFGVGRMTMFDFALRRNLPQAEHISQPGTPIPFTWSTGNLEAPSRTWPKEDLEKNWRMHADSIADFVNVPGFGYVKDRQHVAGFQAHRFSQVPTSVEHWVLRTVNLVGVAVHNKPVAYVTAELPRMEDLQSAATRPLDDFEALGLAAIREGDDLFMRETTEGRRMLGAIRNARQCSGCHGGTRGDLLGAFSYTLTRAE